MIKGIGIDTVEISRIAKSLSIPSFLTSTFTPGEIVNEHGNREEYYATRFACKEAVFKALGIKMDWRKIETLNREDGSPYVVMRDVYGDVKIHISITTEAGLATVFCIIEENNKGDEVMKRLVILGSGGYGRTVADVVYQLGYSTIVLDDADPVHPLSTFSSYIDSSTSFIPAFGNNSFRIEWINRIEEHGGQLATLIHPTAYVSPTAVINPGTVILPRAIVNTDVVVGKGCIISLGAIVDHGCILEEGVHICLGAIVKGENRIEKCSKIEAGEVVERGSRK